MSTIGKPHFSSSNSKRAQMVGRDRRIKEVETNDQSLTLEEEKRQGGFEEKTEG